MCSGILLYSMSWTYFPFCSCVPYIPSDDYIINPEPSIMSIQHWTLRPRHHAVQDELTFECVQTFHLSGANYIGYVSLLAARRHLISPKQQLPSFLWIWNIHVGTTICITTLNMCILLCSQQFRPLKEIPPITQQF